MVTWVLLIAALVCGLGKWGADTISYRYDDSIFEKLDNRFRTNFWSPPPISQYRKWKWGWVSSTVLVSFMDGWHLCNLISYSSWQLALAVLAVEARPLLLTSKVWEIVIVFLVLKVVHSGVFELLFHSNNISRNA